MAAATDFGAEIFPALPSRSYLPKPDTEISHQIGLPCRLNSGHKLSDVMSLAWGLVVRQYTNYDDVAFGVTMPGDVSGIEKMAGTVPLQLRLKSCDSLDTALSSVRNQMLASKTGLQNTQQSHSDYQFQSQLVVQHSVSSIPEKPQEHTAVSRGLSNYALVLVCTLSADELGISVNLRVDAKVVKQEQAEHFVELLNHLVTHIVTNTSQKISNLSFLSRLDTRKLQKWNSVLRTTQNECVHNVIHRQYINRPNASAVCAWDGSFTYADLESHSSTLASKLIQRGIGPETFVPLLFEKSRWTVIAMLAVIKAGGAFVLLDSSYPETRLRGICHDIDCPLILCSPEKADLCDKLGFDKMVVNELTKSQLENCGNAKSTVHPENALYAVFTSGSTGKPKGVVIEHRHYSSAVHNYKKAFRLSPSVRVLQFSSYAFDASIIEMLTTLMGGGCICIPSETQRLHSLASSIHELNANHAFLTPSVARLLVDQGVDSQLKTLALVGEAMLASDVEYWGGKLCLINGYGPAECSVASCINVGVAKGSDPTNIGFGRNAGTICWVVDAQNSNKLLPVGAVGELLVQGPSVGRGYLNDPDKTEASFIEGDPPAWLCEFQATTNHGRMYKTGDLVRYEMDGSLRFVGRKDSQVKLRGQRIELGEVESHLRRGFAGRDVIADVIVPISKIACLVASITSSQQSLANGNSPSILAKPTDTFKAEVAAVDTSLRDNLPVFMVPTLYIPVLHLPKTASGKTDRRLLREITESLSLDDLQSYSIRQQNEIKRPVSTPTEIELQSALAKLLNIPAEQIGAHDSFHHLGGVSIIATKLVAAMASHGKLLTVSDVFRHGKLCDLAKKIDSNSKTLSAVLPQVNNGLLSVEDREVCANLMSTLPQRDERFSSREIAEVLPASAGQAVLLDQCTIAHFRFSLRGTVDSERMRDACAAIISRHSIFRTVFIRENNRYFQVIIKEMSIPYSHVLLREHEGDLESYCKTLFVNEPETAPFDKPPFGFILVSTADKKEHILIIRLAHAQYDALSFPVLLRDLGSIYRGDLSSLPSPVRFSTYVHQRTLPKQHAAFEFWRNYLHGSQMTPLNSDYMKLNLSMKSEAVVRSRANIPLPVTPPSITLATLVKAAWSYVLSQFRQETDVVFGQTVTGRGLPLAGVDEIQGLCLNFIPTRTRILPEITVIDLLQITQSQHTESMRYDYLDLADIIKNSTTWHAGTKYGSILQYQTVGDDLDLLLDKDKDIVQCVKHSVDVNFLPLEETWVFAFDMLPTKMLHLFILTRQEIMRQETADTLVIKLKETVETFSRFPDRILGGLD